MPVLSHMKDKKLKLLNYRLTQDLSASLAEALPFLNNLTYIDLTCNGLSDASGAVILNSLGE